MFELVLTEVMLKVLLLILLESTCKILRRSPLFDKKTAVSKETASVSGLLGEGSSSCSR